MLCATGSWPIAELNKAIIITITRWHAPLSIVHLLIHAQGQSDELWSTEVQRTWNITAVPIGEIIGPHTCHIAMTDFVQWCVVMLSPCFHRTRCNTSRYCDNNRVFSVSQVCFAPRRCTCDLQYGRCVGRHKCHLNLQNCNKTFAIVSCNIWCGEQHVKS